MARERDAQRLDAVIDMHARRDGRVPQTDGGVQFRVASVVIFPGILANQILRYVSESEDGNATVQWLKYQTVELMEDFNHAKIAVAA